LTWPQESRYCYFKVYASTRNLNVTVKLNDQPCTIPSQSVVTVVDQFKVISQLEDDMQHTGGFKVDEPLCTSELTKSVLYAHALDRFLFREDAQKIKGTCLHQLPVFREESAVQKPDMFIVELIDKVPCRPVALSDVKIDDEKKSKVGTMAYCILAMRLQQTPDKRVLLLGLAISNDKAHSFVVVDNDGYATQVEVCTIFLQLIYRFSISLLSCMEQFTVFLHNLHISNTAPGRVPICGMGDATVLDLSKTRNAHVFHSGNTVHKLYDNQFCKLQPNFDAIQSIDSDYLPDMKVVPTDDKHVLCLQYTYIERSHRPRNLQQLVKILKDLEKLHKAGATFMVTSERRTFFSGMMVMELG